MIALHLAIVLWIERAPDQQLVREGALLAGGTLAQPWRLLTSLVLHGDARHVFWNGVSMMVFAIPLLAGMGYLRTIAIYIAAGIGGGIAAVALSRTGTLIIGSSGAVAGLFGAWVVWTLRHASLDTLPTRARIRTLGVALLVLPLLLNPTTSTGRPISISSHLGGLATGMIVGALISRGLLSDVPPGSNGNGEGDALPYELLE